MSEHGGEVIWAVIRMFFVGLAALALIVLLTFFVSCGHLPPHWCRVEADPWNPPGQSEVRHCEDGPCEAKDGEWIVSAGWMAETAEAMLSWRECCEEK